MQHTHKIILSLDNTNIIVLGIHIYADQPRAHKVCIISLDSEHSKLKSSISTCIE